MSLPHGQFDCTIDVAGRLAIPAALRGEFEEEVIISLEDGKLKIYQSEYDGGLSSDTSWNLKVDHWNRITIPNLLLDSSLLPRKVRLVSQDDCFEIQPRKELQTTLTVA